MTKLLLLLLLCGVLVGCLDEGYEYIAVYDDATSAIENNEKLGCVPTGRRFIQFGAPSSEYKCPKEIMDEVYHYGWTIRNGTDWIADKLITE